MQQTLRIIKVSGIKSLKISFIQDFLLFLVIFWGQVVAAVAKVIAIYKLESLFQILRT
jgi:hypothetical protein